MFSRVSRHFMLKKSVYTLSNELGEFEIFSQFQVDLDNL